jgi:ligand-binding sensor domain-containing protein
MWFAGTNLYRYDGCRVVTFKHDPTNPKSISASRVETIYIDRNNIIWIGTFGSGLDRSEDVGKVLLNIIGNSSQNKPIEQGNHS